MKSRSLGLRAAVCLGLASIGSTANGQGWSRGMEAEEWLRPMAIAARADGSSILVGELKVADRAVLVNLDHGGNAWQAFDYDGNDVWLEFQDVIPLDNGHQVVIGFDYRYEHSAVMRLNRQGTVVWGMEFTGDYFEATKLLRCDDGDVLVAGSAYVDENLDFGAIRLTPDGAILWMSRWGSSKLELLHDITSDGENGAVLVGRSSVYGEPSGWLLQIDETGNPRRQRTIGTTDGFDELNAVDRRPDGSYVVAGRYDRDSEDDLPWVASLDSLGRLLWSRQINRGEGFQVTSIRATSDGGVIALGHELGGESIWLAKLEANGDLAWQRQHEPRAPAQVESVDLELFADGSLLVAAAIDPDGAIQPWVLRLNPDGLIGGCCPREESIGSQLITNSPRIRVTELYRRSFEAGPVAYDDSARRLLLDEWVSCTTNFGPWSDEGNGLAGSEGVPCLAGAGLMERDLDVHILLNGARPFSVSSLFIGFSRIDASYRGGTFVPSPDFVFGNLPIGHGGELYFNQLWPIGVPAGIELYLQALILDPTAPYGLAFSNAIHAITP